MKKILLLLFLIFLSSKHSPMQLLWTENALFIVKFMFNGVFFLIFLMFLALAWFGLCFLIAYLVKSNNKSDYAFELFWIPISFFWRK